MNSFVRESLIVFNRQMRMNLRNPAWVFIGIMQPVLYLLLFGPLLEPVIGQLGVNQYTWFVPGMLVQLGIFGAFFAGLQTAGEIIENRVDGVVDEEMAIGGCQSARDPLPVEALPESLTSQRGAQHDAEAFRIVGAAVE